MEKYLCESANVQGEYNVHLNDIEVIVYCGVNVANEKGPHVIDRTFARIGSGDVDKEKLNEQKSIASDIRIDPL